MRLDPMTVAAIAGMAIVTYLIRAGGYWLFSRIRPSPFLRAALSYVPGTLFASFVVPALVTGGLQPTVGAAVTLAVVLKTRSMPLAMVAGTAAAWGVWAFR